MQRAVAECYTMVGERGRAEEEGGGGGVSRRSKFREALPEVSEKTQTQRTSTRNNLFFEMRRDNSQFGSAFTVAL